MSQDALKPEPKPRTRRFWLTVGEVVAVLGLVLAGLGYWENHRDRQQAQRQEAQKAQAQTRSVFVMRAEADEDGERVLLEPTNPTQVVQTQRYLFPTPVLGHGKEIGAGRLQIDLAWFGDGLKQALKAAREAGAPLPKGEARLPVGVVTRYVENGETRTDQSIYRVGYLAEPGLFGAVKLKLLGATLVRRGVKGDVQAAVNAAWRAEAPASDDRHR
ncbi:MAG TPA: hypothetical protein VF559_10340 [Caulobacteraceae bacterium]|jgi:hypothetical protein